MKNVRFMVYKTHAAGTLPYSSPGKGTGWYKHMGIRKAKKSYSSGDNSLRQYSLILHSNNNEGKSVVTRLPLK